MQNHAHLWFYTEYFFRTTLFFLECTSPCRYSIFTWILMSPWHPLNILKINILTKSLQLSILIAIDKIRSPQKNCLLVLVRPTVLSGPTVKVFFLFIYFFNFFIQIQNYIIRKHYWNCQQSIAHVCIGINWEFRSLQDQIRHSLTFMTIISGVGNTVANMVDAMDTTDVCTRSPQK